MDLTRMNCEGNILYKLFKNLSEKDVLRKNGQ